MATHESEFWLTTAVTDNGIKSAIVFAESVRRTRTTRSIGVIATRSMPISSRVALRKAFDVVFYTEEMNDCVADMNDAAMNKDPILQEAKARFFAFSLHFTKRVVFVGSNSILLENADKLFETNMDFQCLRNADGSADLSLFMVKPRKGIWESLCLVRSASKLTNDAKTDEFLVEWFSNQRGILAVGSIEEDNLAKLSMKDGILLTDKTHAPIIRFVDLADSSIEEQSDILMNNLGRREKTIMEDWLELYNENARPLLTDPMNIRLDSTERQVFENEPVAIIGMSCRYPKANSVKEFWNLLYNGEEGIAEPPAFRWTKEHSIRVSQTDRKTNAGFLSTTVDEFDSRFFGVSPKEAAYMDPQARVLHEVMWEALEDSGVDPLSLYGSRAGIFTGSWMNDYKDIVVSSAEQDFFRTYMGNSIGATAARLSFLLGLTGPSIATESGCSSAIVALDLAVKSLRSGESNLALAGGVNLLLHPFTSNIMNYVIAPNGRCKTFDAKADGFGRAEGCGVLVLKRLSDALRDRDNIWAMITGSAVSQEGISRSLGTPTVHCEALAMQLALEDANIRPEQVSFVETHGTGTAVGDPMEVAAIRKAYCSAKRHAPLVIGSVKTNVGHTESCSGITGIMKTVLAMQHELIPKHRNLENLNSEIFLDSIPAIIPLEPHPWPKVKGQPRIAGVSSFGITGTDGHVIIQEAPDYEMPKFDLGMERPLHILKLSAKTSEALNTMITNYENQFSEQTQSKHIDFGDTAFSANTGRASFNHRAFIVAEDHASAEKLLKENRLLRGEVNDGESRQLCFLFTGQGSQYHGMAKTLYESSPVFRVNFDDCDRTLRKIYNLSLQEVLWDSDPSSKEIRRTIYSQTSIFCVEYCLLKLWQSWGLQPDYVLGHSLGEFAAAVAAGVLEFKDALKLVAERSRLIDELPRGSMLVVKASKSEVEILLKDANVDLDLAAVNNPEQTVVAGDTNKVEDFQAYLKRKGHKTIILEATHAFHSRHMDAMLTRYRSVARTIDYKSDSSVQYVSGMEGRIIDASEINADYWVRHTREKVSFVAACAALWETGCTDFLEIGPQPVLSSFVMMNHDSGALNCLPSLRRGTNDWETILTSLGKLYLLGYKVNWKGYDAPYIRRKVSLPFHPFIRKSFWVESMGSNACSIHPLVGHLVDNATSLNIFQNDITFRSVPFIKDHSIGSRVVFPGAGYVEMSLFAGHCVSNGLTDNLEPPRRPIQLDNLLIEAPLELTEEKPRRVQVVVELQTSSAESLGYSVKVFHQNNNLEDSGKWVLHATSTFNPAPASRSIMEKWKPDVIKDVINTGKSEMPEDFYRKVDELGLKFGESFRSIRRFWRKKSPLESVQMDNVVAEVKLPPDFSKYLLHPLIIDAVIQTGILTKYFYESIRLKVPVRIGKLIVLNHLESEHSHDSLLIYSWFENKECNVFIFTQEYIPIAYVSDVELLDTNVQTIESVLEQQSSKVADLWEESWKLIPSPFTTRVNHATLSLTEESLRLVEAESPMTQEGLQSYWKTRQLIMHYMIKALFDLGWQPHAGDHLQINSFCKQLKIQPQFHKLIRFFFTVFEEDGRLLSKQVDQEDWLVRTEFPSYKSNELESIRLYEEIKSIGVYKCEAVLQTISNHLVKILTGQESALSVLFPIEEDKYAFSAEYFYHTFPARKTADKIIPIVMSDIVEACQKRNSNEKVYRVLEVGSGTGSLSISALHQTKKIFGENFEYYYTDVSPSFFINAEKRFEEYKDNLKFAVFNIEESPLTQSIPVDYFDIVIATDVLHATRDLKECLSNLRETLRVGGTIAFMETIGESRDITFTFGILEGYWRFEDFEYRPHHTCVDASTWETLLTKTGFSEFASFRIEQEQAYIVAQKSSATVEICHRRRSNISRKWVIFGTPSGLDRWILLSRKMKENGYSVIVVLNKAHGNAQITEGCEIRYIQGGSDDPKEISELLASSTEEVLVGVIYAWGFDENETDQKTVALPFLNIAKEIASMEKSPLLYVVTRGVRSLGDDSIATNPTAATLLGMAKSLKNEFFWNIFVRCVDLDPACLSERDVEHLLYEIVMNKGSKEQHRMQVAYRDSRRYEPRFTKAKSLGNMLQLPPSTDRYKLLLPKTKQIQDLEFDVAEQEIVGDTEVEVKVKAFALNFKDVLSVLKPTEEFEKMNTIGLDFAGVVTKAGRKSHFEVGERVFGVNSKETQLPSHLVVVSESILRIPDKISFWEIVTLPAVFATAYHCLVSVGKMKKGDTVLIHTGSGGVGLAAIQLAKHIGASIITTAGSSRKKTYLRSMGIENVFHSRDTTFEQDIQKATNGRGVDIVLNSITGPGIKEATLKCCALNARFIEMSKLSIWTTEEVKTLRPDVMYTIEDLTTLDTDSWRQLLYKMRGFLEAGQVTPIPYVKFDALHIRQALQFFQKAKHIGKVICAMPEVTGQSGKFEVKAPLFNNESTYLITGGLGGIGFEVCKWMLSHGATDIVLTGRNPPKVGQSDEIEMLNAKGYNVTVHLCDVSDFDQCKTVVDRISEVMKPLRGVMHCAGILSDELYAKQTWSNFQTTFSPKVLGTWNLHELTKEMFLEHFVMYSSVTALIGTPGQPNHSAANCFEDAFIHYRHSIGLPGTTINWGQWAQVGVAKDTLALGFRPVSVSRMLNGLEQVLVAQKTQVSIAEFDSFKSASILCPSFAYYLDERIWNRESKDNNISSNGPQSEDFWKEVDAKETTMEKAQVVGVYLKCLLRRALRLDPEDKIGDHASLQDLGVDSLMSIELKNGIQTLICGRVTINPTDLKNCNTVSLLTDAIMRKIVCDDLADSDGISCEPLPTNELTTLATKDVQLPNDIAPSRSPTLPSEISSVLVTGATGKLAPYIISELSRNYPSVQRIVCLVRNVTDNAAAMAKVKENLESYKLWNTGMKKLECVSGNLSLEKLGMSEVQYKELCEQIEAVIHCAASSNYQEHYAEFPEGKLNNARSINVIGTLNILRFASSSKTKHIYFASNFPCGLFGEEAQDSIPDTWLTNSVVKWIAGQSLPALQTSKMICEVLLGKAVQKGLPCKVFRFPWIAGESRSGQVNPLNNLYILRYLSFIKTRAMPTIPLPANALPVDLCASLSLKVFFNNAAPNEVYNIGHPRPPVEQEFCNVAKDVFGIDLTLVEWTEFANRLRDSDDNSVKELAKGQESLYQYLSQTTGMVRGYFVSPETFFRNEKLSSLLPNYENEIPPAMEVVKRDLTYLKQSGILERFGM